jgi:hypothetical protein
MTAWLLALAAGTAVHRILVRRPWPRRVPGADAVPSRPRPAGARRSRPRTRPGPGPTVPQPVDRRPTGRRRVHDGPTRDLVACCDLLAVAASAGCTLRESVLAVGAAGDGPVAGALAAAGSDLDRGSVLADAVERVVDLVGPDAAPLVSTLVVAAGSGAPVAPALQRLADAERRRRRRGVEARIRRLPVLLLLPLVTCILPAFVVLTLVPVGIAAARSGLGAVAAGPDAGRARPTRSTLVGPSPVQPSPVEPSPVEPSPVQRTGVPS